MWCQTIQTLRHTCPETSLHRLCGLFGKSRQAYYKWVEQKTQERFHNTIILNLVDDIRACIPRIGTRKLFHMLGPEFSAHGIKIGRDKFFDVLRSANMLVRPKKKYTQTTDSKHFMRKYTNLIKDVDFVAPNRLWVSDITYIKVGNKWNYAIFITDYYSKKVVGYNVDKTMDSAFCELALQQALSQWTNRAEQLIHHSDRGLQYCSNLYTNRLKSNQIAISMTESGDPRENAVAERINGIFKSDFNMDKTFANLEEAQKEIEQMVHYYNSKRPHSSLDYLTPNEAHEGSGVLRKRWKAPTSQLKNSDWKPGATSLSLRLGNGVPITIFE